MFSKKRLFIAAGAVTALGAAATLITGITFGLFSASAGPQSDTFTAGTVSFGAPTSVSCTVGPMEPGDASTGWTVPGTDTPCTFQVTYTGNLGGFIGLGLTTSTTTTSPLYDGTATGLQFLITDNNGTSYTTGGVIHPNTPPASPLFVRDDAGGSNTSHTFTVNYELPVGATNAYQGMETTLTLTVYAVQDSNNGSSAACTAGTVCAGITSWS